MASKGGVKIVQDRTQQVAKAIERLATERVMVGFPNSTNERREADSPLSNAQIAYIQNYGAPEANIPQREFMAPGIRAKQTEINAYLKKAGKAALEGDIMRMDRNFAACGLVGEAGIKLAIQKGIPPPLAQATVDARRRRHPSRKATTPNDTKPLIDTGQMYRAVTYVVRKKGES